jgi:lipopolysaccharide/colanic/teichoic acid biosynthesis glycosyltransferase
MTGWAQVHGRAGPSWEERIELDVWYVDNRSLGLDLRILARTLGLIVAGRGLTG